MKVLKIDFMNIQDLSILYKQDKQLMQENPFELINLPKNLFLFLEHWAHSHSFKLDFSPQRL